MGEARVWTGVHDPRTPRCRSPTAVGMRARWREHKDSVVWGHERSWSVRLTWAEVQADGGELDAGQKNKVAQRSEIEAEISRWEAFADPEELSKEVKKLGKKLRQIEELEAKKAAGEELLANQEEKILSKDKVAEELKKLEAKALTAPHVPAIKSNTDDSNFDEFEDEAIMQYTQNNFKKDDPNFIEFCDVWVGK